MKYLGWANGWGDNYPIEVKIAKEKGYEIKEIWLDMNTYRVECEEGGWYYNVDCS